MATRIAFSTHYPDHFWMWFDQDFDGALLELESVGGMKTQEVNEQNQL